MNRINFLIILIHSSNENLRCGSKSSLEESSEIILYKIILYTKGTLMHDPVSKIFLTLENLSVSD